MKFIKSSYEVRNIPDANDHDEVLKHLERIGRVCYKSEDKITDESAHRFLEMIRDRGHWAMLEHFIFVMEVPSYIYDAIIYAQENFPLDYELHNRLKYIDATPYITDNVDISKIDYNNDTSTSDRYIVSGSATAFNNIWKCKSMQTCNLYPIAEVCTFLLHNYPELMIHNDTVVSYDKRIRFLSKDEIKSLPISLRMIHDSMSIHFITSRAVSHDLVRHRPASWAMESTRYVNYFKRFGIQYIIPVWFSDETKKKLLSNDFENHKEDDVIKFIEDCKRVESIYNDFIEYNNYRPEQAMHMLPHKLKTELTMTARLSEWRHFFTMRADSHARLELREIVVPLFLQMLDEEPDIFGDLNWIETGMEK